MIDHQADPKNLHAIFSRNDRKDGIKNQIILDGVKKQMALDCSLVHMLYRIWPESLVSSLHISVTV